MKIRLILILIFCWNLESFGYVRSLAKLNYKILNHLKIVNLKSDAQLINNNVKANSTMPYSTLSFKSDDQYVQNINSVLNQAYNSEIFTKNILDELALIGDEIKPAYGLSIGTQGNFICCIIKF